MIKRLVDNGNGGEVSLVNLSFKGVGCFGERM